jgi:outer membrane protein OmpA-like peptidoglycan-associated protein
VIKILSNDGRGPGMALLLVGLVACSSPPKPPTVDDSLRRPVNDQQALKARQCTSELAATKIVLTEALARERRVVEPSREPEPAAPTRTFVVTFETGATQFRLADSAEQALLEEARKAAFVVIRGRTDASVDSALETAIARRRAEAAQQYLAEVAKMPGDAMRVTWQGAGDPSTTLGADRRVEMEFYATRPQPSVWIAAAASR